MDTKTVLIGVGLLALGGGVWYITHRDRQNTNRSNQATADNSDPAVQLAQEWFSALNVKTNMFNTSFTAGWTLYVSQSDINRIYNVALKTYNWAQVQNKFSALCNGTYTLTRAMQDAIGKEETAYKNANNYASMKKVLTTNNTVLVDCDKTGKLPTPTTAKEVKKGVIAGAFIDEKNITRNGETLACYICLNSVDNSGNLKYYATPKKFAKLV